jgi:hypothetical protein
MALLNGVRYGALVSRCDFGRDWGDPDRVRAAGIGNHSLGSQVAAGFRFHPGMMGCLTPERLDGVHALAAHLAPRRQIGERVLELLGPGLDARETFDPGNRSVERLSVRSSYRLRPPSN